MSIDRLENLYHQVCGVILSRQHPITGLFPASTAITSHGDYTHAWVRDNVYSIQGVWALSMAYRRHDNPKGRAYQLECSVVKCLRGLLNSMMRQSDKVEAFKYSTEPLDALHAKYDTTTGAAVVGDDEWGHLQIDATALFLLTLTQVISSGQRVIYTKPEVDFIQNLVYYIGRAYRIEDYGIWERGNKVNNGRVEINSSSVGMAKAALEALDEFNLFSDSSCNEGVIHVIPDEVSRARMILESQLPDESRSKECDSALLSIISYPAFAVEDHAKVKEVRHLINEKLAGKYGCKRFLLDGHQSVLEDKNRLYYQHHELSNFDNIESEWPLFYTYLLIDRVFHGDHSGAQYYRDILESLMIEKDGQRLLPELYYVPEESILAEKSEPGSQVRTPNENVPLVWAQSLYIVGALLHERFLTAYDIDALRRYDKSRTRLECRQINLVLIAEDEQAKSSITSSGLICSTLDELSGYDLISSTHLSDIFSCIGVNKELGLSGRPHRLMRSLTTSSLYKINGRYTVCLNRSQTESAVYRGLDIDLLLESIYSEINYIKSYWSYSEIPVFTLYLDNMMCNSPDIGRLLDGIKSHDPTHHCQVVNLYFQEAISTANVKKIDIPNLEYGSIQLERQHQINRKLLNQDDYDSNELEIVNSIVNIFERPEQSFEHIQELFNNVNGQTLLSIKGKGYFKSQLVRDVCRSSAHAINWRTFRMYYALLNRPLTNIAEAVTEIIVQHRQVLIGDYNQNQGHINRPDNADNLYAIILQECNDPLLAVLLQETLVDIAILFNVDSDLFHGLHVIKVQYILELCLDENIVAENRFDSLLDCSPYELFNKIKLALASVHLQFMQDVEIGLFPKEWFNLDDEVMHKYAGISSTDLSRSDIDWLQWRRDRAYLTKVPSKFIELLWGILPQMHSLVFGDIRNHDSVLDAAKEVASTTQFETSFKLKFDKLIAIVQPVLHKSLVFEFLITMINYCQENQAIKFVDAISIPNVISLAAHQALYASEIGSQEGYDANAIDYLLLLSTDDVDKIFRIVLDNMEKK